MQYTGNNRDVGFKNIHGYCFVKSNLNVFINKFLKLVGNLEAGVNLFTYIITIGCDLIFLHDASLSQSGETESQIFFPSTLNM